MSSETAFKVTSGSYLPSSTDVDVAANNQNDNQLIEVNSKTSSIVHLDENSNEAVSLNDDPLLK